MVHFLAPLVLVDVDAGLLFYFAMGTSTELAIFMAGWSSRNKYSLLGAMRAVAQKMCIRDRFWSRLSGRFPRGR